MQYLLPDLDMYEENETELIEDLEAVDSTIFSQAVVFGTDWTTDTIVRQVTKGNIVLDPEFQRRDAWSRKRKSNFIESVFLGLPIPQLVLAESKEGRGKYLVIDGKQRLLSLMQFYEFDGYNSLKLSGLELLPELNNKTLCLIKNDVMFDSLVSSFENQPIRTVVIKNWKDESLLYHIFLRLNTGSVGLSPQELRQALHPGPFVSFVDKCSMDSVSLRVIYDSKKPDFRMRDVELLIRFYAFRYFISDYSGNLKKFLDNTCKILNNKWSEDEDVIKSLVDDFEAACGCVFRMFGDSSFKKWLGDKYERKFNKAIFDFLVYYFSFEKVRVRLIGKEDAIVSAFKKLFQENDEFVQSVERTTKSISATSLRLSVWGRVLADIIGSDVIEVPTLRAGQGGE
ncbi:DUF262 domain-containing protein [Desulfovibrio subterraneus]|uniref:DUF262 domain-containing protein n=1 Tax=Desulfovibrio subterraneus TaxID=2718620 RepID=UPI0022B85A7D|nr:DUF262 domain-containing protein [Desulfovibrio subterraneus]WBF68238.1 DUF262 domain-containing protein [Desulfovibrio subterraneus]